MVDFPEERAAAEAEEAARAAAAALPKAGADDALVTPPDTTPAVPASSTTTAPTTSTTSSTTTTTPAAAPVVETPEVPSMSILSGDIVWYWDPQENVFYAGYLMEGGKILLFEADADTMEMLFGVGVRPPATARTLSSLLAEAKFTYAGSIFEMEGEGNFAQEVARITALALDEGKLPDWATQSQAAMDIIYIAQAESKSNDWVLEQLSKLPGFKTRFPGMDKLMAAGNLTLEEGISGFLEFEAGVRTSLNMVGASPDQVTPELIGDLLAGGHNLKTVTDTIVGFDRLSKFAPAMQAFNSILAAKGLPVMSSLQDMMTFISGQAPVAMYDLWEASSIAEAAQQAGLGKIFSAEDAMAMGLATDHNLETATAAAKKTAELLLRLRYEVDVSKFGLTSDELLDVSFGRAPRSGRTETEVNESMSKAVVEAQKWISTQSASAYKGFDEMGRPRSVSMSAMRMQT